MAVFRIEKTRDYTVMSNYHLRDMSLSLKAKGLLSLMLSLPENWDYTMKGLARICKDGIDSISGGIRELEAHGYLIRARVRGANGQLGSIEYTILEQPKAPSPTREKPIRENPVQVNPMLDAPIQENPAQLNKEESSNYPSKTDLSITQESSPILSSPPAPKERAGQDGMRKRESYRALILENIEYDVLSQNVQLDKDRLDELVELMVDTVCSNREMIRVAGDDYPAEVVRSRFLKLNASHIEYVLDRMRENTTYVRNIKKYLLALLHGLLHPEGGRFAFEWDWLPASGLSVKDFIAPSSFEFGETRRFRIGEMYGAVSFLQILAPEIQDRILTDFMDVEGNLLVTMHVRGINQNEAIKMVKRKITDLDAMKIQEQKKAARSGYDLDILPSDLSTYGGAAKNLLQDLQSRNERMFNMTFLMLHLAPTKQKLEMTFWRQSCGARI